MNKTTKTAGAGVAALAMVALSAGAASAESTLIKVGKYGALSASHNVAFIKLKLTCSPDTTYAEADLTLTQVTHGTVQTQDAMVTLTNALECSGNEEVVFIPVRRKTGGFAWVKGAARVSDVNFNTEDPGDDNANNHSHLSGRTVYLR